MEKLHMAGFQEAAVVPQSLPLGLLGDNRSAGAPRPYPSGETCRSPPLLPELNSQAGTEDIGGVALAVMAGPETELVKGPASPQPEVRRRKFKRARVVKEIETVKMGTAGEWEQANPLEKERAKMGASVQRFLARMQDVQGGWPPLLVSQQPTPESF